MQNDSRPAPQDAMDSPVVDMRAAKRLHDAAGERWPAPPSANVSTDISRLAIGMIHQAQEILQAHHAALAREAELEKALKQAGEAMRILTECLADQGITLGAFGAENRSALLAAERAVVGALASAGEAG
jgi:hypothetical protein